MNTIIWHNRARKQIKRIPRDYQVLIFSAVDKLTDFPDVPDLDMKALKNHPYGYRLRVGRYRVLFDHDQQIEIISIQEVKNVMNKHTEAQIIHQDGKPVFAVIPWDEYQDLLKNQITDESDTWFPNDVVKANVLNGDCLVKAWREHFGLTQAELAQKAGMKQSALARLEKAEAAPRKATLAKLAKAMDITVEQLID